MDYNRRYFKQKFFESKKYDIIVFGKSIALYLHNSSYQGKHPLVQPGN